jgi:dienelactone hydrolase
VIRTVSALIVALASSLGFATQDLPRGVLIDPVTCLDDSSQSYALYLPTTYNAEDPGAVLMGFHAGGRGRAIVETYQAAAERYGYIVAASNNSRNGPWAVSAAAVKAMSSDVAKRFAIDARRVYLTGLSGGARVALQVALGSASIAGVIASSAGFPDSEPRQSVPFALFATTGTSDFNYIEMHQLDRKLTSPHRLAVFDGGHTLPPADVALEAIEWLELHAMKSDRRPRDPALIDRLFATREQKISAAQTPIEMLHLLEGLTADFSGLHDMTAQAARLAELSRQPDVKKALSRERSGLDTEARLLTQVFELEASLRDPEQRQSAMGRLRDRLSRLAKDAAAEQDSPQRNQARRMLRAVTAGAAERVQDPEYRKLLAELAPRGR